MFLTLKEVMERYKASRSSVYRWAGDPDDPFPQPGTVGVRCTRWLIEDLEAYDRIVAKKGLRKMPQHLRAASAKT